MLERVEQAAQDRERLIAAARSLSQERGVTWLRAVLDWHGVDSLLKLSTPTLRELITGTHPIHHCGA